MREKIREKVDLEGKKSLAQREESFGHLSSLNTRVRGNGLESTIRELRDNTTTVEKYRSIRAKKSEFGRGSQHVKSTFRNHGQYLLERRLPTRTLDDGLTRPLGHGESSTRFRPLSSLSAFPGSFLPPRSFTEPVSPRRTTSRRGSIVERIRGGIGSSSSHV